MNETSRVSLGWPVLAVAAVALLATGAGAAYLLMAVSGAQPGNDARTAATPNTHGDTAPRPEPGRSDPGPPAADARQVSGAPLPDVGVPLTREAAERAGLVVASVAAGTSSASVRVPGVVQPNAYRQVVVTPLVGGRLTQVRAELGQRVARGETLAAVFSPDLAEAQTRYVASRAELEAHEREVERTQKLVEIGAATRQELERIHAQHIALSTGAQSARSRLVLLGVPAATIDVLTAKKAIDAIARVPAPISGVITERQANVGVNVDLATRLFTVTDLSTVWIVGDVYEMDVGRIRVGSDATITIAADPDRALKGRVSYIDPQVRAETRTAQIRVEVPNPHGALRLGSYAEMLLRGATHTGVPMLPRGAVQSVEDRQVVYLVDPKVANRFTEREVRLGQAVGDQIEVLAGVQPGDEVVAEGSFFVRAERERLGLRPPAAGSAPGNTDRQRSSERQPSAVQTAKIAVVEHGYQPDRVMLRAGVPARLTFVRRGKTCGTAVALPSLNIRRELPLDEPVEIEFTPHKTGEIEFVCGMKMLRGTVVVQ